MNLGIGVILAAALPLGGCYGLYGNDEFDRYVERMDVITTSAGDAKEVNAVTHTNDPWPRRVGDRRIPMEGSRAVRAIDRYRNPPQAAAPTNVINIGGAAPPAGGGGQ